MYKANSYAQNVFESNPVNIEFGNRHIQQQQSIQVFTLIVITTMQTSKNPPKQQ